METRAQSVQCVSHYDGGVKIKKKEIEKKRMIIIIIIIIVRFKINSKLIHNMFISSKDKFFVLSKML